eukprot:3939617-Rhodomonas_salina.1
MVMVSVEAEGGSGELWHVLPAHAHQVSLLQAHHLLACPRPPSVNTHSSRAPSWPHTLSFFRSILCRAMQALLPHHTTRPRTQAGPRVSVLASARADKGGAGQSRTAGDAFSGEHPLELLHAV